MRRDNRGLSLVELVIVITIMAVLGGLMAMGISAAITKPAEECAKKLAASLKEARVSTMGKRSVQLKLYTEDGYIYVKEEITLTDGTVSTKVNKIGEKGVEVTYCFAGESSYQTLGSGTDPLTLSFDRSNGGFKPCKDSKYCGEIKVKKGTREQTLKLYHLTGKVTVE